MEVIGKSLDAQECGQCLICNKDTAKKETFRDTEKDVQYTYYFDLCEDCKLVPNCFTCRYSKMRYLRYKGKCDIFFKTFEGSHPDCRLFRRKYIGENITDYWNHNPCGRYQRGDATKREFDEANYSE